MVEEHITDACQKARRQYWNKKPAFLFVNAAHRLFKIELAQLASSVTQLMGHAHRGPVKKIKSRKARLPKSSAWCAYLDIKPSCVPTRRVIAFY